MNGKEGTSEESGAGLGGTSRSQIMESIAKEAYAHPRAYGFRSAEDVGEAFERYWTRIEGLVDRYEDVGSSFDAFVTSSLRYIAASIRRRRARDADREAIYLDDRRAASGCACRPAPRRGLLCPGAALEMPSPDDDRPVAKAFRRRVTFLCAKCANLLDDGKAAQIARRVGLDESELIGLLSRARSLGLGVRRRTTSRRRGRDAAWLRIGVNRRRLGRETDPDQRRYLSALIERDRGRYERTIALMSRSSPIISNREVALLLGVPKGTVDCGVGRILKRYSEDR